MMGADLLLLVPKLQLGNTSVQKLQLRLRPFPSWSLGRRGEDSSFQL
jgi:hypothetical protein